MKRKELVRQLEEMGCILSDVEEDTIGIRIRGQKLLNPFRDIMKSTTILQNISKC